MLYGWGWNSFRTAMAKMAISFFGTSPTNGEFVMVISPFSIGSVENHHWTMIISWGIWGMQGKNNPSTAWRYISCILGTQPIGFDIATTDDIDLRYKNTC